MLQTLAQSCGLREFELCNGIALYRSREPHASTTPLLKKLGIVDIYDLRKPKERENSLGLSGVPFCVHTIDIDLQGDAANSQTTKANNILEAYGAPGERMKNMYRTFAWQGEALREVILSVMRAQNPALVHCVNGKDRAGVVCACVKKALGETEEAIYADYLATNEANQEINERDLRRYSSLLDPLELEVVKDLFLAKEEYLEAFWEEINKLYGSFDAFLYPSFGTSSQQVFSARGGVMPVNQKVSNQHELIAQ